jgi:hypothetical protein
MVPFMEQIGSKPHLLLMKGDYSLMRKEVNHKDSQKKKIFLLGALYSFIKKAKVLLSGPNRLNAKLRYLTFFLFHLLITIILLYAIAAKSAELSGGFFPPVMKGGIYGGTGNNE